MKPYASAWGIDPGYHDYRGHWRESSESTTTAMLDAMGATTESPPDATVWVVRADQQVRLGDDVVIRLEAGGEFRVHGDMPADTPWGYHTLVHLDGREHSLIVCPGICFLPRDLHTWGWGVQLYSVRSSRSWGIGDLGDLRELGRWSRSLGAGMMLLNPLHAALPTPVQQPSPYSPSSRRFRNPLYLRIEDVPGAAAAGVDVEALTAVRRALNTKDLIDRDAAYRLKMHALDRIYRRWPGSASFDGYCIEGGRLLWDYAAFVALAELHGGGASKFPTGFERPDAPAVKRWRRANADRLRFHVWVQWLLETQLQGARDEIDLVHDLAIGVDAEGADAWIWQDVIAAGTSVGAPPDEFNALGQDWGMPPFDPWKLRASGYEAFIETVRSNMTAGAGLRFDHIMGLFRLFWIPQELGAEQGSYVRYPFEDLLNILSLESHRARSYVVGEDLGTVEPFVREEMQRRNILGYRLMWFEEGEPEDYPELAMAAVTNHDLPTLAGLWSGADLRMQQELKLEPNVEGTLHTRERLRDRTGVGDDAPADEMIARAYDLLARAPSKILVATLEDALGAEERPNQPGTIDERPNWSIPLPAPLEAIVDDPRPRRIAEALNRGR
ncbi:MAG: 4-alpha-glucanotransferase [Actinomycetota bacterium]